MIKIFHFTNLKYGLPYIRIYEHLPIKLKSAIEVSFVFSSNIFQRKISSPLKYFRYLNWKRDVIRHPDLKKKKVIITSNVNKARFYQHISFPSIAVCTGFNQIFGNHLLGSFEECYNIHPSILPYYRGPAPNYWVIENKEKFTGVTLHKMTEKIDSGEIILQKAIEIEAGETERSLNAKTSEVGANLYYEFLLNRINNLELKTRTLNVEELYSIKEDYLSFPQSQ